MSKSNQIIVGWGLAGATLAWQMYFRKQSFKVYDSTVNTTTRAAAGIVNPIVFKRLTQSWNATKLIPYAASFYAEIETILNQKIIYKKNIYKVFNSFEDENNWATKQNDINFKPYLLPLDKHIVNQVSAPYGFGVVKTFGNLNTSDFLSLSKQFFKNIGFEFIEKKLNYNSLSLKEKTYEGESYNSIYFCEGSEISKNPLLNYLPLKPTHGEIITIRTSQFEFEHVLNKNMFVMHIKDNIYKVGATINWDISTPLTTENGKSELIQRLRAFTSFDFEVIDHQAGVRPTVKDRRPLIGKHPLYPGINIFNGLGTKGVMIAPYYANQLLDYIDGICDLDNEVNISRYEKFLH